MNSKDMYALFDSMEKVDLMIMGNMLVRYLQVKHGVNVKEYLKEVEKLNKKVVKNGK